MKLGIESYIATPKPKLVNVSLESIMTDYVACEAYCGHLDKFCRFADELCKTMDNIRDIARTISKHNSTEALATVTDLFKDLNGHVSIESLKEKAGAAWAKIKEWFNKLGAAIAGYWRRFLALFTKMESRLNVYKNKLNSMDESKYEVREWTYNGADLTGSVATGLGWFNDAKSGKAADLAGSVREKLSIGKHTVQAGAKNAVSIIDKALALIKHCKDNEKAQKDAYAKAKTDLSKAEGENNINAAKEEVEKVNNLLKAYKMLGSTAAKTAASILSNCRVYRKAAA